MPPRLVVFVPMLVALALAGCRAGERDGDAVREATPSAWRVMPRVEMVRVRGDRLSVSGVAEPGARVVVRDGAGAAHAATADADGGFVVALPASSAPLTLRLEDQNGQSASAAPELVVVLPDGTAATLSPGLPSRRLDPGEGLSAVDSDGRMVIVSGRTGADRRRPRVRLGRAAEAEVAADVRGVWVVRADAATLDGVVSVDGRVFHPRFVGASTGSASTDAEGTTVAWQTPDGAALWTWLPAR